MKFLSIINDCDYMLAIWQSFRIVRYYSIMKPIFITLLLIANTTFGQSNPSDNPLFNGERKFTGGLVGGINACQVDGDYLNGYHKLGVNVGAVAFVNFTNRLGASLELLYSQKGSYSVSTSESPYFGPYFAKYSIHLNYAEVPVVFHYYITPRYHLGVGASYNVLVGSKEMYNDASFNTVIDAEIYPFNRQTFDGLLSGNAVLWRGLMLNVRYQYSLTTIRKLQNIPTGLGFENQKNNMFTFRFMYLF